MYSWAGTNAMCITPDKCQGITKHLDIYSQSTMATCAKAIHSIAIQIDCTNKLYPEPQMSLQICMAYLTVVEK